MGGGLGKGRRGRGWGEAEARSRRAREEGRRELSLSSLSLRTVPGLSLLLPLLEQLDLSHNDLSSFPDELWGMQVLRVLNLSGNRIEGVGRHYSDARKQIGLFRCESIDLSSNQLQDWPTFLSNLPKLHSLVLSANPLGTPSEGGLAKFTSLTELGLGAGLTSEAVLSCLRSCPALESLTLENNGIGRAEWMVAADHLHRESPEGRGVGDSGVADSEYQGGDDVDPAHRSTGAEAKDRDLTRSADRPEPVDPNIVLSWKAIGSMYWVKTLNLSRNQLNCVPKLFSRFTNLESLNLSNNVINRVPELELPALKKIDLSHNLISDLDGIDKHFHGIQDLNISWNKLVSLPRFEMQDEGSFSRLTALQDLDLSSNAIKDIRAVAMCPVLTRLFFKNNPVCSPPKDVLEGGLSTIQNWVRTNRQAVIQEHDQRRKQEEEEKKRLHDEEMEARYKKLLQELDDDDDKD